VSRALIFDFDFTLADSSRGFLECHQRALTEIGLPSVSPAEVLRTIGMSLPEAFRHIYGEEHLDRVVDYVDAWQRRADSVMTDLTTLFDGVADTIRKLRRQDWKLAIVSQKLRYRIEDVLAREGLLQCFAAVIGGGDMPRFKPEPDGLFMAMQTLGTGIVNTLYVGDSEIDGETAARAGVPFIAVLTGVTAREALAGHEPIAILDGIVDLPDLLREREF
jgi:phosphoglycolate phosphatase